MRKPLQELHAAWALQMLGNAPLHTYFMSENLEHDVPCGSVGLNSTGRLNKQQQPPPPPLHPVPGAGVAPCAKMCTFR